MEEGEKEEQEEKVQKDKKEEYEWEQEEEKEKEKDELVSGDEEDTLVEVHQHPQAWSSKECTHWQGRGQMHKQTDR